MYSHSILKPLVYCMNFHQILKRLPITLITTVSWYIWPLYNDLGFIWLAVDNKELNNGTCSRYVAHLNMAWHVPNIFESSILHLDADASSVPGKAVTSMANWVIWMNLSTVAKSEYYTCIWQTFAMSTLTTLLQVCGKKLHLPIWCQNMVGKNRHQNVGWGRGEAPLEQTY